MKTVHVLALVALLSVLTQAQSQPQPNKRTMADITYAIKGPVKSFRIEVATFVWKKGGYVEGPRVLKERAFFNRDGYRTDYYIYQNGKLARQIVMKYEGKKNIESMNYDGNGTMWWRAVRIFDDTGLSLGARMYDGNGTLLSTSTLKRNANGQVVEASEHSAAGVLLGQTLNKYEGNVLDISVHKTFFPNGLLKSEETLMAPNNRYQVRYNPDGTVANSSARVGQEMSHYDADGSLRKATFIAEQDRLLDELKFHYNGSVTRETQLPDEVDQYGNWTIQTKWFENRKGTRPLVVTYRTLTYY